MAGYDGLPHRAAHEAVGAFPVGAPARAVLVVAKTRQDPEIFEVITAGFHGEFSPPVSERIVIGPGPAASDAETKPPGAAAEPRAALA